MLKNGIALLGVFALSLSLVNADVVEVDCSTSPIFSQYSCNQCFDG
jgi:hypothetical protein